MEDEETEVRGPKLDYVVIDELIDNARYTKDLEDMLRRVVEGYKGMDYCRGSITNLVLFGHRDGCVIAEAMALLEHTGHTED